MQGVSHELILAVYSVHRQQVLIYNFWVALLVYHQVFRVLLHPGVPGMPRLGILKTLE